MEEILFALFGFLYWRVLLCTLGSAVLAFLLSKVFTPFTAAYCLTLVILGCTFGAYWESRASARLNIAEDVSESQISPWVAFLGLAFVGLVLGGVTATLSGSPLLAVAVLFLGAAAVALWQRIYKRKTLRIKSLAFVLVSLLLGFLPVLLFTLPSGIGAFIYQPI